MKSLKFINKNIPKQVDQRILAYIVCVLIASVLWFLNALNKKYTTDVAYPIQYTGIPVDSYMVGDLPEQLTFNISGKGFNLMGYKMKTSFQPIELDFSNFTLGELSKDSIWTYKINTNDLRDKIAANISEDITLNSLKPEQIVVRLTKASTKRVPVESKADYILKPQYTLKDDIVIIPDTVTLVGSKVDLEPINAVYTEARLLGMIDNQREVEIRLVVPENIQSSNKTVKLHFDTEQYTEISYTLPIRATNVPDSISLRLLPSYVSLTANVGLSKFDQIKEQDFEVVVDYSTIDEQNVVLKVELVKKPKFVSAINYNPQKVEYIIERNTDNNN